MWVLCFLCSLCCFPMYLPSVLWYCWLGLLTCKNRLPYNLYCVGGDVKHCTIQSKLQKNGWFQSLQICLLSQYAYNQMTNGGLRFTVLQDSIIFNLDSYLKLFGVMWLSNFHHLWKLQMMISLERVALAWSTLCVTLWWGFRGWQIELFYFWLHQIREIMNDYLWNESFDQLGAWF